MQYARIGEYLSVTHISGPTHNLLQVCLGSGSQAEPVCEQLPAVGKCVHEPLDEQALVAYVLKGVAEANVRFGTSYSVTHIRYVRNDTRPEAIYAHLSSKLIEHLESGGQFQLGKIDAPNQHAL
jgi:hypothetical protein